VQTMFPGLSQLQTLGEGGQKWVYACNHPIRGRIVLKLIKPHSNIERIEREIQAVIAVKSARVPQIYEANVVQSPIGPLVWIQEELVAGQQLRQIIESGPLGLPEAKRLAIEILEALADAEAARVVHRDVKPDNIMRDSAGHFWLLDFGIARHLDLESLTASGPLGGVGTPGYAPPEQFQNKKRELDSRADLFALGVTLYEAIHATNPFRAGALDVNEVCRRVASQALPLAPIAGDADSAFGLFIRTMVQSRRDHRPASATVALEWARQIG
jgi:serine/threonine protein kinase